METTDKKVLSINLDEILPNRFQPRIKFEESAINELAESIKEHGVIQPIVVRPIADKYEIIAGERRYKASVMAGKTNIPAIIVNLDDKESAEIALIENVQRQDLTPIEEAVSYKKILDMGYLTQQQLAGKLGKSQATVANKMRLLNLHEDVQEALLHERISERHARSLLKIGLKDQEKLLKRIIEERLTVRKTDEEINKILGKTQEVKPMTSESKLEVVDFAEEKGELNMNNQDQNQFINQPQVGGVNPGFMDINKIEAEATDIYQPEPVAPVGNLLEPSTVAPAPAAPVEPVVEEPLINGRFFNMFEEDNNEGGNTVTQQVPVTETIEPVTPVLQEQPMFNAQDIFAPLAPVEPLPVVTRQDEQPIQEVVTPVNEVPAFAPQINPVVEEVDLTPIQPVDLNAEPIIEATPSIMPAVEEIEHVNFNVEPVSQPAVAAEPVIMETPIIEEGILETVKPTAQANNTYVVGDLKTVINTIRNCATTIEKYGYNIDVEEVDFENTYQVTFKIEKKN